MAPPEDPLSGNPRYGAAVLDHFERPRHAGRLDPEDPDVGTGEARLPDGERLILQVRRGPDGRIREARFRAFGCPITIACGSWAAERLSGLSLDDDESLAAHVVARALALAPEHAALAGLPLRALRAARADLRASGGHAGPG